ncbi:MAG: type VI secretion system tube protein Hcp [Cellvibrionaceae bacterium]|nr:type VI secretion system tube protein Hcp [Cellvibrionaceae bacterium]
MTKTGAGNGADVFTEYTLTNALLSNMRMVHNGLRPIEKLKISFTSMSVKYITYDEDGNAKSPEITGFDTATNTKI